MSRTASIDRDEAGFTIIEALIALAVVAVAVVAIGSVMSGNARGVRSVGQHVALMQTARAVLATAIPPRQELAPGTRTGESNGYRWQVDIAPLGGNWIVKEAELAWIPELIKVHVRSPSGARVELDTVRLARGQNPS